VGWTSDPHKEGTFQGLECFDMRFAGYSPGFDYFLTSRYVDLQRKYPIIKTNLEVFDPKLKPSDIHRKICVPCPSVLVFRRDDYATPISSPEYERVRHSNFEVLCAQIANSFCFSKSNEPHKAAYKNSSESKLVPFNLRHNFDLR
jgi:hypothetical protein